MEPAETDREPAHLATNGQRAAGPAETEMLLSVPVSASPEAAGEDEDTHGGCSVIVLFCHPRNVEHLLAAWRWQIAHAAGTGELPLRIGWSGRSGLLGQGVIVLSWEGVVPAWFRRQLSIDHEIFDFVIDEYGWVEQPPREAEPRTGELTPGTGTPARE